MERLGEFEDTGGGEVVGGVGEVEAADGEGVGGHCDVVVGDAGSGPDCRGGVWAGEDGKHPGLADQRAERGSGSGAIAKRDSEKCEPRMRSGKEHLDKRER